MSDSQRLRDFPQEDIATAGRCADQTPVMEIDQARKPVEFPEVLFRYHGRTVKVALIKLRDATAALMRRLTPAHEPLRGGILHDG